MREDKGRGASPLPRQTGNSPHGMPFIHAQSAKYLTGQSGAGKKPTKSLSLPHGHGIPCSLCVGREWKGKGNRDDEP